MNNQSKKGISNKHVVASLFVIGLILMVIGVSYAMYVFTGTGTTENVITTGQITVAFEEKNNILIKNRYAETDAVGLASTDEKSQMTFTVSSNIVGDATVNYVVGLVDIKEGATLKQDHIKIYLTKNGQVANGFTSGTGKIVKNFATSSVGNYLDSHAITQGVVTGTQTDTYTLKAWIDESYNLPITDKSNGNVHGNETTSETFEFKVKVVATDTAIEILKILKCDEMPAETTSANVPSLAKNMIPVCYNSEENVWLKADSTNTNSDYRWYSYSGKTWANAVTVTEVDGTRSDLVEAEVGTEIPMERINTMMVWIPRFSATGDTANYNGGTKDAPGAFNITFVSKTSSAHDAFDFGGAVTGLWVGKYENSSDKDCDPSKTGGIGTGCNLKGIKPKIVPNATSWRGAMISTFFYDILDMIATGNPYGFFNATSSSIDTHLIKNSEWAAVTYLTQSIYGRCMSSTNCTEVGTNNHSEYITGYGSPAGSDISVENGSYETILGMNASTTGNIYGIYDMSGGAAEYVMGVYWNGTDYFSGTTTTTSLNSGFNGCLNPACTNKLSTGVSYPNDKKYVDLYTGVPYNSQHAIEETKVWYGDGYTNNISPKAPWINRGGTISTNSKFNLGIFCVTSDAHGSSKITTGSRTIVIVN